MSWADDNIPCFDGDYIEHCQRQWELSIKTPSKWVTNDGNILLIKNMETSHIRNCIRLIEQGKIKCQAHKLPTLRTELQKRLH